MGDADGPTLIRWHHGCQRQGVRGGCDSYAHENSYQKSYNKTYLHFLGVQGMLTYSSMIDSSRQFGPEGDIFDLLGQHASCMCCVFL